MRPNRVNCIDRSVSEHIGTVCTGWPTWFTAAVTPGDAAGHILGSVSVTAVSLQLGETRKFRAGCFTQGSVFFRSPLAPFVAREKRAGLLGWEWIYVFALLRSMNGSKSLRLRKHGASAQLQRGYFGGFRRRWSLNTSK